MAMLVITRGYILSAVSRMLAIPMAFLVTALVSGSNEVPWAHGPGDQKMGRGSMRKVEVVYGKMVVLMGKWWFYGN